MGRRAINGGFGTREYQCWGAMIQRCTNTNHPRYKYYGARGISICERWRNSFAAFLDDMGERPEGYELDRIDNDGHYEPENCRWTTAQQSRANRRKRAA